MAPPDWTDHDVHDPGVTLLQLLAFLAAGVVAWRLVERRRRRIR